MNAGIPHAPSRAEHRTDLWLSPLFKWTRSETEYLEEFRVRLRNSGCELGRYLADVHEDSLPGIFQRQDVNNLEKKIVDDYGRAKCLPQLRMLDKLISHLNRIFQKSIPRPQRLKLLAQESNVLKGTAEAQQLVNAYLQAESSWIERSCPWPNNRQLKAGSRFFVSWEMVVLSAALHSGILRQESAVALVDALCNPQLNFACSQLRGYADLRISVSGSPDCIYQRWYPDNRLLLLLSRVDQSAIRAAVLPFAALSVRDRQKAIGKLITDGVLKELRSQNLPTVLHPSSLADLLAKIEQSLRTSDISNLLVNCASGRLVAHSQIPHCLARIYGDPMNPTLLGQIRSLTEDTCSEGPQADTPEAYSRNRDKEDEWMTLLRRAFTKKNPDAIEETLRGIREDLSEIPPVAEQLISLARSLLKHGATTGNDWAISSIKCCVLTVARRFGIERVNENPAKYSSVTLQELYITAIQIAGEESKSPARLQRIVAWALREYQRHLVCAFGAHPVDEAAAFRYQNGPFPVDARVIAIDDLFKIIEFIKTAARPDWLTKHRKSAIAEAVFAFLGGLRRHEGLGLELQDCILDISGLALIRENSIRDLKTPNARRAIFLATNAYPFTELVDYISDIIKDTADGAEPVFGQVSEDVVIPIIHESLRTVTGDPDCHLHTLRHSFGTWMFMRLMLADMDSIPELFPHLQRTTEWLNASRTFRQLLYGNDLVQNDHAWALAAAIGHSTPASVSIPTYVHCCDILLAMALRESQKFGVTTDDQLRRMSGMSKDSAYHGIPSGSPVASPGKVDSERSPMAIDDRSTKRNSFARELFRKRFHLDVLASTVEPLSLQSPTSWLRSTEDVAYLHSKLHMTLPDISASLGLDVATTARITERIAPGRPDNPRTRDLQLRSDCGLRQEQDGNFAAEPRCERASIRGNAARQFAKEFAQGIGRFTNESPAIAMEALEYIARNLLPGRPAIAFLNPMPEIVRNCLHLFNSLGLALNRIQAFTCDGTARKVPSREWLQRWGLSWRWNIVNQSGRQRLLRIPKQWVVIEPVFSLSATDQKPAKSQERALRYVLQMAATRFVS